MSDHAAAPKRPTKRERDDALNIIRNEEVLLRAWAARWGQDKDDYMRKTALRRLNKADRLTKVIAWLETL